MAYDLEVTDSTKSEGSTDLERKLKLFKEYSEAWTKQAQREQQALRFQVPEKQWDEDAKRQRLGMAVDGVPTPARPILSIPRLAQPIRLIINQERGSKLGVNIHPLSAEADEEVAEIKNGIYRRCQRESQAGVARSWAFDRAVKAGRGFYRIGTEYDESSEDPFDQTIVFQRILDQSSVKWDPSATKPDFSDAKGCFIAAYVRVDEFKRMWPDAKVPGSDDGRLMDSLQQNPDWVKGEGEDRAVLVAEFWERKYKKQRVAKLETGEVVYDDAIPKKGVLKEMTRDVPYLYYCKFTAAEELEGHDWPGKYIPIITVLGEELQMFDGERRWFGVIEPNMDAQRMYNYAASQVVEMAALEPKAPFVGVEGQFEGFESQWQQANVRNWPYLEYKAVNLFGAPAPPPQRVQVDASRMGPAMTILQQADQFLQQGTFTYDPSLGRPQKGKSGIAIEREQAQGDASNSNYLHNLADVSMPYESKVFLDLLPAIYDREGRIVRTVSEDEDDSETVILNQPFYVDPKTKRPVPVNSPEEVPPGVEPKFYDLSKGIYDVSITIGRSYQNAMQQASAEIGEILQADPSLMPLIGPIYFRNRDFPGSREIADVLKKVRNQNMPFLDESEEGQPPSEEQLMGENQQLKQQMQEMQAQLQQAGQIIQTEQVKQSAQLKKAEMDNQTKLQVAGKEQETKILLQAMSEKFDRLTTLLEQSHETTKEKFKAATDSALSAQEAAQDAAIQAAFPKFAGSNDRSLGKEDEV